jgi:hypothetical protein
MAYSTIAEFRDNVNASTTEIPDADVTSRIALTEKIIKTDLGREVDFSLVPTDSTDSTFPYFVALLSQYKTAELCVKYMYTVKQDENLSSEVTYWRDMYDELVNLIKADKIALELTDGTSISNRPDTFENNAKSGIEPALGVGEYGGFLNKDDLIDERPTE